MTTAIVSLLFAVASFGIAFLANGRFKSEDRLPMQWWLGGQVTWSAARPIALAFIPGLATILFARVAVLSIYIRPRPGQEHILLPSLVAAGVIFLCAQHFHLWMIERTVRQKDR